MPNPFSNETVRRALTRAGQDPDDASGISVPRHADAYSHTLAVVSGAVPVLPVSTDPSFLEAIAIANDIQERNLRRQVLCAVYRRILLMPDRILAIHFPGTRYQRDQWVRRGLLRLMEKSSDGLKDRLNRYSRSRGDI